MCKTREAVTVIEKQLAFTAHGTEAYPYIDTTTGNEGQDALTTACVRRVYGDSGGHEQLVEPFIRTSSGNHRDIDRSTWRDTWDWFVRIVNHAAHHQQRSEPAWNSARFIGRINDILFRFMHLQYERTAGDCMYALYQVRQGIIAGAGADEGARLQINCVGVSCLSMLAASIVGVALVEHPTAATTPSQHARDQCPVVLAQSEEHVFVVLLTSWDVCHRLCADPVQQLRPGDVHLVYEGIIGWPFDPMVWQSIYEDNALFTQCMHYVPTLRDAVTTHFCSCNTRCIQTATTPDMSIYTTPLCQCGTVMLPIDIMETTDPLYALQSVLNTWMEFTSACGGSARVRGEEDVDAGRMNRMIHSVRRLLVVVSRLQNTYPTVIKNAMLMFIDLSNAMWPVITGSHGMTRGWLGTVARFAAVSATIGSALETELSHLADLSAVLPDTVDTTTDARCGDNDRKHITQLRVCAVLVVCIMVQYNDAVGGAGRAIGTSTPQWLCGALHKLASSERSSQYRNYVHRYPHVRHMLKALKATRCVASTSRGNE
jgi:hypothetical protein